RAGVTQLEGRSIFEGTGEKGNEEQSQQRGGHSVLGSDNDRLNESITRADRCLHGVDTVLAPPYSRDVRIGHVAGERVMSNASRKLAGRVCLFGGVVLVAAWLSGWDALVAALADGDETAELEVVIKREALKLTDPRTYSASMHLDAAKTVDLTAPSDGYVRTVSAKPGQKIKAQSEAVRLDDTRAALVLK